jgi:hypothetical protein
MNTPTTSAGRIPADLAHLYRVRNGVRAALALGVAASVAGNVLHAEPTIVGRAIASWSPLALLLTVELISRVPVDSRRLAALRMISTGVIAGIAAWVSYWHMVSVAARNGESASSAHLLPLSVDGLVVVASVSLVEIAARLRATSTPAAAVVEPPAPVTTPDPDPAEKTAETSEVLAVRPRVSTPARRTTRPASRSAADKVTRLRTRYPEWTVGQIAEKAGVTERTARRHLNTTPTTEPVVGPDSSPDASSDEIAA